MTIPLTGLLLHHLGEYDGESRAFETRQHALDRGPGVLAVVADSPAARAGFQAGDTLLALNGAPFPSAAYDPPERTSKNWRAPIEASEAWFESALRQGPADVKILRNGQEMTVRLEAARGCPARARLARSNQANAFANRGYVVVTTRMLAALRSDDELAIIVGHELAHAVLGHEKEGGTASRIRAAEEEADRLGLRLAAAAGYDLHAAIPMWRRLYRQFGGGLQLVKTHPGLRRREQLIEATIAQLESTTP